MQHMLHSSYGKRSRRSPHQLVLLVREREEHADRGEEHLHADEPVLQRLGIVGRPAEAGGQEGDEQALCVCVCVCLCVCVCVSGTRGIAMQAHGIQLKIHTHNC